MAQITEVRLLDDLDGGEAAESVAFNLDGKSCEIDLREACRCIAGCFRSVRQQRPPRRRCCGGVSAADVVAVVGGFGSPTDGDHGDP
jgi:hypothetical protein